MRRYVIDGQNVYIEARALRRYFWLGMGFVVRVGDNVFLSDEELVRNGASTKFQFYSEGELKEGVVRSTRLARPNPRVHYEIVVDGIDIVSDSQPIKGILLTYLIALIIGTIGGAIVGLIVGMTIVLFRSVQP